MRSRGPWRPLLPAACRTFSTSSGVRYSLERRSTLSCRRGGRGELRVDRDLGAEVFVLRRRDLSFPFTSVGARLLVADFPEGLTMGGNITFPLRVIYGKKQPESIYGCPGENARPEPPPASASLLRLRAIDAARAVLPQPNRAARITRTNRPDLSSPSPRDQVINHGAPFNDTTETTAPYQSRIK